MSDRPSSSLNRNRQWLMAIVLLGVATTEGCTVLAFSSGNFADAAQSGVFLVAICGLPFTLGALMSRTSAPGLRPAVRLGLIATRTALCVTIVCVALFWGGTWLMGERFSADTLSFALHNPFRAILHLVQSDPLVLAALLCGLTLACIGGVKLHSQVVRLLDRERTKTIVAANLTLIVALCAPVGVRTDRAALLDASYGSLIGLATQPLPLLDMVSCGERAHLIPYAAPVPVNGFTASRPPVIVIIIEALRSDILSTEPVAMPFLASIAPEGVLFDKAYSTASHTDFANLAIWYSRYPFRADHRLGYPYNAPWRGLSAFEYFKLNGYTTAYFSSQNEKWGEMINWLKRPGTDTFFHSEDYDGKTWENDDDAYGLIALIRAGIATAGKVEDSITLGLARNWIEQHAQKPFFIGMDLQNTHYSYVIPDGGSEPFKPDDMGFRRVYATWPKDKAKEVRNRYLNAAWNVDRDLANFVRDLRKRGIWDRSMVVIVGDHGEAFYEHGFANHSGPLYDDVARTFAWVKFPKGDPRNGHRFSDPISHVDLIPLAVATAGLPPWPGFQGIDPWHRTSDMPIFLAANALVWQIGVVRWPWKLLVETFPKNQLELYKLDSDPAERRNLSATMPAETERLRNALEEWRSCQIDYYDSAPLYKSFDPPHYGVLTSQMKLTVSPQITAESTARTNVALRAPRDLSGAP